MTQNGREARFVGITWAVSRLWLGACAYAGHRSHPFREPIVGGYSGVSSWWLNVWTTYDSTYYLEIAQHGYRTLTSAFFPLYPLLLRPFAAEENSGALVGVIISNLAFLIALWLVLRLATMQLGETVARRTVLMLAFFPSAVFSMAVYTDALFLMLSLAALYAARNVRWKTAALFGALAAFTRNAGAVLAVALLVEWWTLRRKSKVHAGFSDAAWLLSPLIAFVGIQVYFRLRFGAVTLLESQSKFGRAASVPWVPVWRDMVEIVRHGPSLFSFVTLLNVTASCLVFVLIWAFRKRIAKAESVVMGGIMLMQLCWSRTWPPYTISSLRYVLSTSAFPESVALTLDRRFPRGVELFIAGCGILVSGFVAYLFGLKVFVS
jgi:Mannosyltransferase (PIG-V)